MNLLLDTHVFLWWVTDDHQLSSRARRLISDSSNEVYFSAASGWEIAIKARLGRLKLAGDDIESLIAEQVTANGFEVLPIYLSHALRTFHLPDHHNDPFDRVLVSQAQVEGLALISADHNLAKYKVRVIW